MVDPELAADIVGVAAVAVAVAVAVQAEVRMDVEGRKSSELGVRAACWRGQEVPWWMEPPDAVDVQKIRLRVTKTPSEEMDMPPDPYYWGYLVRSLAAVTR